MHGFEVWMRNEQKSKSKVYTSRSSSDLSCFFSFDLAAENTTVRQPLCTCTMYILYTKVLRHFPKIKVGPKSLQ